MKKKLASMMLILVMALTLCPVSALAAINLNSNIVINGASTVDKNSDYTFSFTLPEGMTPDSILLNNSIIVETKQSAFTPGTGNTYTYTMASSNYQNISDTSMTIQVYGAIGNDGYYNEKTVTLTGSASAEDPKDEGATKSIKITGVYKVCKTQAYNYSFTLSDDLTFDFAQYEFSSGREPLGCYIKLPGGVGNTYTGTFDPKDYGEETEFTLAITAHTKTGETIKETRLVEILADHTGGEATCISKATCSVCGTEYGDYGSHKLTHVAAKAATKTTAGNKEYWYCSLCDKYFSDAAGTKAIKKADTVIAKLSASSPKTADSSNTTLLIALLLASGCGAAFVSLNRKRTNR